MIHGIGVDVVEVARIARAMGKPRFVERILTPNEREECTTPAKVAGRWAAKEAIAKALAISLSWQDVEILSSGGPPKVRLITRALRHHPIQIHVSISHEKSVAIAMAVVESLSP